MDIRVFIQSRAFKLANTVFWLILFVFSYLKNGVNSTFPAWGSVIYWPGAYFIFLWLLSPIVFFIVLNTRYYDHKRLIKSHTIYGLLFGITHFIGTGISILLLERLFKVEEHYTLTSLLAHFKYNWIELFEGTGWYILMVIILSAIHYYILYVNEQQRHEIVKSDLVSSNLQVLSIQLSPHFLFNAMNSIAMMVRRAENKRAVTMIAALSDMLRMAMSRHKEQLVNLQSEIELLDKYLILEKERFKDRVELTLSFPDDVMKASVPRLVLQPLVENAFKHGAANNLGKSSIEVNARRENDRLFLSVYNSGQMSSNWDLSNSSSLGLPNTIHRLRQLYESDFNFKIIEQEEGVLFQISLPFLRV